MNIDYIPPTSIACMVDFLVAITCANIMYRRKKILPQNIIIDNFLKVYIILSFGFFLFTLPSILIFDPSVIQFISLFGNTSFIISMSFLLLIPAKIFLSQDRESLIFSWILRIGAVIYLVTNLILFRPAQKVYFKPFVDWREGTLPFFQFFLWFLCATALVWMVILFVVKGWLHEDSFIRKRSRIFAIGFAIIFIGWLMILLFQVSASKNPLILFGGGTVGVFFVSLGMIVLLIATAIKDTIEKKRRGIKN
jgi:hypothetical protein